jgi:hypothetical protein
MRGDAQAQVISHLPDICPPKLAPFLAFSFWLSGISVLLTADC